MSRSGGRRRRGRELALRVLFELEGTEKNHRAVLDYQCAELEVTETDPGFRGDTANAGTKPAVLETGAVVDVPLFVNQGDRIRVDTRTGRYMERA